MDQYEMPNVRKPRACKRGRPCLAESAKNPRKTRKTRTGTLAELLQQQNDTRYASASQLPDLSAAYSMQGPPGTSMQQPEMPVPYGRTDAIPTSMHQQEMPVSYPRTDRRTRSSAAELTNMLHNPHGSRYTTPQQQELQQSQYPRPTQRHMGPSSNVSQVLYPNIVQVPRTTATYTVPEQLPQLATMSDHPSAGPRYNTRRAVHNLPLPAAPTMGRNYWNSTCNASPRPPVPQMSHGAQTMSSPAPVACPLPKTTKEESNQTELTVTDDEVKLLKLLRSKRMDVSRVNVIIESDEYIVTYNETEERNNNNSRSQTITTLMRSSQQFKTALAGYCARMYQESCAQGTSMQAMNPAIMCAMNTPSTSGTSGTSGRCQSSSAQAGQQEQQEEQAQQQSPTESATQQGQGAGSADMPTSPNTPPQPTQGPQLRMTPPMMPGFPIPSIFDQYTNFRRQHAQQNPNGVRPNPPFNFNFPFNLFQNFQYPHLFMDPRFMPHPPSQDPDQYGMAGWF